MLSQAEKLWEQVDVSFRPFIGCFPIVFLLFSSHPPLPALPSSCIILPFIQLPLALFSPSPPPFLPSIASFSFHCILFPVPLLPLSPSLFPWLLLWYSSRCQSPVLLSGLPWYLPTSCPPAARSLVQWLSIRFIHCPQTTSYSQCRSHPSWWFLI